jgi:integrase
MAWLLDRSISGYNVGMSDEIPPSTQPELPPDPPPEVEAGRRMSKHMKRVGLLPGTQRVYRDALKLGVASSSDLLDWVHEKAKGEVPIGTLLPVRSAVKHYLVGVMGYHIDEVEMLLPRAQGVAPKVTEPLTLQELALFHAAVDRHAKNPAIRTILHLLSMTGMQLGETLDLKKEHLWRQGDNTFLEFDNAAGGKRVVPLSLQASQLLLEHIESTNPSGYLFPGRNGHLHRNVLVRTLRKIEAAHPELKRVGPRRFRSTAAMLWLARGEDPKKVQAILGHRDMETTRRYVLALRNRQE